MAIAKKLPNAAARSLWTSEVVARRAADLLRLKSARRFARYEYKRSCESFKQRRGLDRTDVNDPAFRRATRKAYLAFLNARTAEANAMRRLETAVRNCCTLAEVQ